MGKGNLNKVDYIVDEILKNNKNFKLKSIVEQDKEKEDIAKSINSALSELNEVGIDLVLKDLSVDPDEKFKAFIDSSGNIDILGILKKTSDVVNSKIEEAQREGFDIRKGSHRVLNNENALKKEDIIALVVLEGMVNNFKNLSREDRAAVVNNWNRLNKDQQAEIMEDYSEIILDGIDNLENEKDKEFVKSYSEKLKSDSKKIKNSNNKEEFTEEQKRKYGQQYMEYIKKTYPSLYKEFLKSLKTPNESFGKKDIVEIVDMFEAFRDSKNILLAKKIDEEIDCINKGYHSRMSKELKEEIEESLLIDSYRDTILSKNNLDKPKNEGQAEVEDIDIDAINISTKTVKDLTQKNKLIDYNEFKEVLNDIPKEMQKKSMIIYISTLKSFDITDITLLKSGNIDTVTLIEKFLKEDGLSPEIAKKLAKNDFNGHLFEYLENENKRREFFEELDKFLIHTKENEPEQPVITDSSIEQGIEKGILQQEEIEVDTEKVHSTQADLETKELSGSEDIKIENLNLEQKKVSEDVDKVTPKIEIIDSQGAELSQEESQEAEIPEKEQEDNTIKVFQGIDLANLLNSLSDMPDLKETDVIDVGKETGEVTKQVKVVDGKIVENPTDNPKTQEQNQDEKDEV